MVKQKYVLGSEKKIVNGITFHRIEALIDFWNIKKGDKGGWIESEKNLSQEDDAWVSGNAWVSGDARVSGNAKVKVILCSQFNFSSTKSIEIWLQKEKEFLEETKNE